MSIAADYRLTTATAHHVKATRTRRLSWLPLCLWLVGMAALATWKGAHHAEGSSLRAFLSWTAHTDAAFWWGGAVLFGVMALAALVQGLMQRGR